MKEGVSGKVIRRENGRRRKVVKKSIHIAAIKEGTPQAGIIIHSQKVMYGINEGRLKMVRILFKSWFTLQIDRLLLSLSLFLSFSLSLEMMFKCLFLPPLFQII